MFQYAVLGIHQVIYHILALGSFIQLPHNQYQFARLLSKATSDLSMAALHMKEELKCVMLASGVQSVMTYGMEMMLELLVGSWDFLHGVSHLCFL